jgi:hypothetical protein
MAGPTGSRSPPLAADTPPQTSRPRRPDHAHRRPARAASHPGPEHIDDADPAPSGRSRARPASASPAGSATTTTRGSPQDRHQRRSRPRHHPSAPRARTSKQPDRPGHHRDLPATSPGDARDLVTLDDHMSDPRGRGHPARLQPRDHTRHAGITALARRVDPATFPASAELVDHLDLADDMGVEVVQLLGRNPKLEDRLPAGLLNGIAVQEL